MQKRKTRSMPYVPQTQPPGRTRTTSVLQPSLPSALAPTKAKLQPPIPVYRRVPQSGQPSPISLHPARVPPPFRKTTSTACPRPQFRRAPPPSIIRCVCPQTTYASAALLPVSLFFPLPLVSRPCLSLGVSKLDARLCDFVVRKRIVFYPWNLVHPAQSIVSHMDLWLHTCVVCGASWGVAPCGKRVAAGRWRGGLAEGEG